MMLITRKSGVLLCITALLVAAWAVGYPEQTPAQATKGDERALITHAREEVAKTAKTQSKELAQSLNQFTLDLYHEAYAQQAKETANFVIAPFSVAESLGLAYVGARGKTAAEIAKVLHLNLKHEQVGAVFASLGVGSGAHLAEAPQPAVVPRLGVRIKDTAGSGVEIIEVKDHSPAQAAGLRPHDRIIRLGDFDIQNAIDYYHALDCFSETLEGEVRDAKGVRRFTVRLNHPPTPVSRRPLPQIATAFWARQGLDFVPMFRETAELYFDAPARTLDFRKNPGQARNEINRWVAEKTDRTILNLLPADSITPETALVLTNAISFQAEWTGHFSPEGTTTGAFYAPEEKRTVHMMHKTAEFKHFKGDGFQVLELPLEGDYAMDLVLPTKTDGLPEFDKSEFTIANIADWLEAMRLKRVRVALPRFKIAAETDVKQSLAKLGMTTGFGKEADFSGITKQKEISLSNLLHKAEIEVNEKGVRATAATALTASVREKAEEEFTANHPFLFLIRDTRQGVILFIGRVMAPPTTQKSE